MLSPQAHYSHRRRHWNSWIGPGRKCNSAAAIFPSRQMLRLLWRMQKRRPVCTKRRG
ncbi:hypothetical protein RvVAR031_34870 [Agrobacterium vitis]|nr:hypothetical protein RvVAR031_34870 [Agrobacterium vitis]